MLAETHWFVLGFVIMSVFCMRWDPTVLLRRASASGAGENLLTPVPQVAGISTSHWMQPGS